MLPDFIQPRQKTIFTFRNCSPIDRDVMQHWSMIVVKSMMPINQDYQRMHASVQSLIIDMFKKSNI